MKNTIRRGIIAGGNWIVDFVKMTDVYPGEEALANIRSAGTSNGGAPYSVLKAVSRLNVSIPLAGIGRVGDDESGRYILDECRQLGIDVSQLKTIRDGQTSYTDVMTVAHTGRRTFFHFRGVNSGLGADDFDFKHTNALIFHLGYLLLLDQLDTLDHNGVSEAAKVLASAKAAGLLTSVDIVSEQSDRYGSIIPSALPYTDILFINEFEAQKLTGEKLLFSETGPSLQSIKSMAQHILDMGANGWVVIHFPQGAVALHQKGTVCVQNAVKIPPELIRGTVGAGDAFAAGVLTGIHEGNAMDKALKWGVCVAAASLTAASASEGIKPLSACLSLMDEYGITGWINNDQCNPCI